MTRGRHIAANRGFSLIEVMVAVSITAMIGGLVYASFHQTFNAKEVIENEAERYRTIRAGLTRMAREISMAYLSGRFDGTRFRDNKDRPTFFTGERDRLIFTSFAHQRLLRDAKESDQCVLEYKVGRDAEDKRTQSLLRREKAVIDDDPERGGSEEALIDDVKKIEFNYWDPKKREWVDDWDTRRNDHPDDLPDRVRIAITVKDETGKEQEISTQARIYLPNIMRF